MLELTGLVVFAVAQTCRHRGLLPGDAVEVTWRHYAYDPDGLWFLEIDVLCDDRREHLTALAG